jgi:SAM-dependent methyltransferase
VPNLPPQRSHDPYEDVPYTDHAYAESHPDRLAVVARMSGWEPPAIENARILELGCAVGGNLLSMAEQLPNATLVGVDRSRHQIDEARRIAAATHLSNVTFHDASFEAIDLPAASFDFVIAHGVYSWIPLDARRDLLRVIARSLAPGGVAYVSFNTLPGWYERLAARDWLRFTEATPSIATPGKEALAWLKERASPELDSYRRNLDAVARRLDETERAYLVHEYLSPEHRPELVTTVLAEAEAAGLRYLGDAIPTETALELVDDETQSRAIGLDVAATQQLVDFVKNTAFRRALFVRGDTSDERKWKWPARLDPRALGGLRIASRLRIVPDPGGGVRAEGPGGSVHVFDPDAQRALHELSRVAPRSLPFDALVDAAKTELFDLFLAIGGIDFHAYEPRIATTISARPEASAVARYHAQRGGVITNMWHQEVRLVEDVVRDVLGRLDGAHTCGALTRELGDESLVRACLDLLAKSALLVD